MHIPPLASRGSPAPASAVAAGREYAPLSLTGPGAVVREVFAGQDAQTSRWCSPGVARCCGAGDPQEWSDRTGRMRVALGIERGPRACKRAVLAPELRDASFGLFLSFCFGSSPEKNAPSEGTGCCVWPLLFLRSLTTCPVKRWRLSWLLPQACGCPSTVVTVVPVGGRSSGTDLPSSPTATTGSGTFLDA